jgi:hypothetical protein
MHLRIVRGLLAVGQNKLVQGYPNRANLGAISAQRTGLAQMLKIRKGEQMRADDFANGS